MMKTGLISSSPKLKGQYGPSSNPFQPFDRPLVAHVAGVAGHLQLGNVVGALDHPIGLGKDADDVLALSRSYERDLPVPWTRPIWRWLTKSRHPAG
jgi:hypothetical protein